MRAAHDLPALPLAEWRDTRTTLHILTQIVGKVRLALHPKLNHWWHAPLYVSTAGLTTGPIPHEGGLFEIELDLIEHAIALRTSGGDARSLPVKGSSVSGTYSRLMEELERLGIRPRFVARPFDPARVGSDVPFAEDVEHGAYDPEYADRFRRVLVAIEPVFQTFRGRFVGKCSPVHLFWHSLDLAVTRFSGRPAPVAAEADPVTREAYSHEVISAGFWAGDDDVPEPCFYAYVAPEPEGLGEAALRPPEARWKGEGRSHMALYRYDDMRTAADPPAALLEFLESTYDAGARLAGWPAQA